MYVSSSNLLEYSGPCSCLFLPVSIRTRDGRIWEYKKVFHVSAS